MSARATVVVLGGGFGGADGCYAVDVEETGLTRFRSLERIGVRRSGRQWDRGLATIIRVG